MRLQCKDFQIKQSQSCNIKKIFSNVEIRNRIQFVCLGMIRKITSSALAIFTLMFAYANFRSINPSAHLRPIDVRTDGD